MKKANYKDQESKEHTPAFSNDRSFPRHISNTFVCFLPLEQCVQALMITALRWAKNQIGFARSKSSHNLKQKLSTRLNWFCQSLGSVKRPDYQPRLIGSCLSAVRACLSEPGYWTQKQIHHQQPSRDPLCKHRKRCRVICWNQSLLARQERGAPSRLRTTTGNWWLRCF